MQLVQLVCAVEGLYVPAEQLVHWFRADAPDTTPNVPAGQPKHWVAEEAPVVGLYVPAVQLVQVAGLEAPVAVE